MNNLLAPIYCCMLTPYMYAQENSRTIQPLPNNTSCSKMQLIINSATHNCTGHNDLKLNTPETVDGHTAFSVWPTSQIGFISHQGTSQFLKEDHKYIDLHLM